jgi:thioester reductase-like protein
VTRTRKILLTGATGFVGGELLKRLLVQDERPIACLVRAASDAEARRRGEETLVRMLGLRRAGAAGRRVQWLPGNVERPDLGWAPDLRRTLARGIEEIFHCAASTRFDLPLADGDRINVGGVIAVHEFAVEAAANGPFRRLHHVSTAFAAGRQRGLTRAECLPVDRERRFRNTYERTKARAERFLRLARRVPTTIYRPSIIVGDSRDGHTSSWNVVYFPMRLMASGRLHVAPCGRRALVDCVPVDYVVDGILALGRRADGAGQTFHLTAGPGALDAQQIVRQTYAGIARLTGHPLFVGTRLVGPLRWWLAERIFRLRARGKARELLARFRPYVPYTRIDMVFENRREAALLAAAGVRAPDPADFFPRVVDYALRHEFGRRPAAPPRPSPPEVSLPVARAGHEEVRA